MSIEQSVIFCDYNTRLMDVPKSCFLPNKIGHKTTICLISLFSIMRLYYIIVGMKFKEYNDLFLIIYKSCKKK